MLLFIFSGIIES